MPPDLFFLKHIRDALEKIERYTDDIEEEQFTAEEIIQDAVVRQLEIVGEAAKKLSESTRLLKTQIPWKQMARMRDYLIHHYFSVDIGIVWSTIQQDLPELRLQIQELIEGEESDRG